MMNKYDEILQIFASQKDEISHMSNKINELERTNMFLMHFIEKKKELPAVCDISAIRRYKEMAIDKEMTLNTARDKIHTDATICDTSLNTSFEVLDHSESKNSFRLSGVLSEEESFVISPSKLRLISLSRSDDITPEACPKVQIPPVSRSTNLNLKISNFSPSRRQIGISRNILSSTEHSNTPPSQEKSQSSYDKKNTIIRRSVPEIIQTSNDMTSSTNSDIFKKIPKTTVSVNSSNTSQRSFFLKASDIVENTADDDKLKHALDYLIKTLEERKCRGRSDASLSTLFDETEDNSGKQTIEHLLNHKNTIMNDLTDRHTQMKLLLTSQQLKADLLHRSLESNNKKIFDAGCQMLQHNTNSSNRFKMAKSLHSEDSNSEIRSEISSHLSEIKVLRQHELNRLNHSLRDQALCDPRVRRGFARFTAIIKGYIVRTLLETDKVRSVEITIKDTAKMILKIRQERLAGDCGEPGDNNTPYNNTNRRHYQETASFQNRLTSQFRNALSELHDIFFVWSSQSRMTLIRNHINKLISSSKNYEMVDNCVGQGSSTVSIHKIKKTVPLSSATVKRRQKLALRRSEGNFKSAVNSCKETGSKNAASCSGQRKPIYTSPYGCRGYSNGSFSRSNNSQSRNANDRKSRSNILSHRRGTFRKIPECSINEASENPKSSTSSGTINNSEQSERHNIKAISNANPTTTDHEIRQQQQQWIPPKTITTSVCSPASGDGYPYKSGFVAARFDNENVPITLDENSVERKDDSNLPRKSTHLPSNYAEIQANTNNADWRSKTFNFNSVRRHKDNNNNGNCLFDDNQNKNKEMHTLADDPLFNVEVDLDMDDYSNICHNHSPVSLERYRKLSSNLEDPTDTDTVVLVDVSLPSTASESTTTELKSTYNSNTNHCLNKPVVTASNTKYLKLKTKPQHNSTKSRSIKPVPAPIQITEDFDLSPANIVSGRTFKIRKRIVACNSIYS